MIERAVLQICVDEQDQDVLRFLLFDDIAKPQPEVQILKFTRVVFGVSSSPFLLNATIRHHLKKYMSAHPQLVKRISESIYVDDVVSGAETEGEAFMMYRESKAMLRKGGFNLRKFNTNTPELRELIREENAGCPSPAACRTPFRRNVLQDSVGRCAKHTSWRTEDAGSEMVYGNRSPCSRCQ